MLRASTKQIVNKSLFIARTSARTFLASGGGSDYCTEGRFWGEGNRAKWHAEKGQFSGEGRKLIVRIGGASAAADRPYEDRRNSRTGPPEAGWLERPALHLGIKRGWR
jgi:hypothetical protein